VSARRGPHPPVVVRRSAEDYLETMLILEQRLGYIRSIDIANEMKVKKPSVTYATKRLREDGYITMDDQSRIFLTETGRGIATRIYGRHTALSSLFIALGVDREIAFQDACRIEHDLSSESFAAICRYIKLNPPGAEKP